MRGRLSIDAVSHAWTKLRSWMRAQRPVVLTTIFGLAGLAYVLDLPAMPHRIYPVCRGEIEYYQDLEGDMAEPFLRAYLARIAPYARAETTKGGRLYATRERPPRGELNWATKLAIRDLLEQRHGSLEFDKWWKHRAGALQRSLRFPPCTLVAKFALKGGDWAEAGPDLSR